MIATEAEKSPAAAFGREILPEIACDRLNALRDDFEAKKEAYELGQQQKRADMPLEGE